MISVVIPTHNRPKDLRNALESVFNQTVLPDELIVVDDGSSPAVNKIILANAPRELKTIILRNEEAKGANNARNRGIKEASGDWIAFLDDDDEFMSNKIEYVTEALMESNDRIDFIYHPALISMVNENVTYTSKPRKYIKDTDMFKALLIKNCIGGTPMVTVRREKIVEAGLFDENLNSLQDYEMWIRLAENKADFQYLDTPLTKCYYTTKRKSVSKSLNNYVKSAKRIENKYSVYKSLSERELYKHKIWIYDRLIYRAYLNKNYFKSIYLNFKAFIKFGKVTYLLKAFVSLSGSKVIFKLRSLKG